MNSKRLIVLFFVYFLNYVSIQAQTIHARVIDQKTNIPVPFATIQLSENQGVITNEEGRFNIVFDDIQPKVDSIYISSMGYDRVAIAVTHTDSIIYITPKAIELSGVFVSNKNLGIDEIMDRVKENLSKNYNNDLSHQRLFFRKSNFNDLEKLYIEFKKSSIEEINKKFVDSVVGIIPRKAAYFTESLCDVYGNNDKRKLNIVKAAELYDKNSIGSMEELAERLENIFNSNIKKDSYLKIKSGLFGTKIQVDSILEANYNNERHYENTNEYTGVHGRNIEGHFHKNKKKTIHKLLREMLFEDDSDLNFIDKSGKYLFTLEDYTSIGESSVYVINFFPKRSADFKGTLYVNTEDFAIMRMEYYNVKNLKSFNLLGIKFKANLFKGTTIFAKGMDNYYHLKYLEKTTGTIFGVDRPLKIIEKNKNVRGRRKQNELSLGIDVITSAIEKFEVVVFNNEKLSKVAFQGSQENPSIKPKYMSKYDPEFWKGYSIIEPNSAIREFAVSGIE